MRITGLHVDGFGALCDLRIDDLSPGLVIVSGPNEAGKSTLLDFVTAMLFGFPSRRDHPRFRQPVRGGRHGGRLTLAEDRGEQGVGREQTWQIERYASPRKELLIRRPDAGVASEEDLRRALGGADEALFRAVFGIDLTDLSTAEPLARDDVRELLFSASIVGQRRSAARAMTNLHKQRLELARLRQGDARANRLLSELDDVRRDLLEAGREAGCYPAREADVRQLERAVSEAREDADRSDRRMRELDLLVRLWDVLERRRAGEGRLSGLEDPAPIALWLEDQATELRTLRSACSGHLERAGQLAELSNQRGGIEQSLQVALASLGPDWDRHRVRSSDGWITLVDEGRHFRDLLGDREARWRTACALAAEADSALELAGLAGGDGLPGDELAPPPRAAIDAEEQAKLVGELRRNLAEQRRLVAERQAAEHADDTRPGALGTVSTTSIALVAIVIVTLAVVAAFSAGRPAARVLFAALAAAGGGCALLTLAVASRRRVTAAEPAPRDNLAQASEQVATRVAELASSLGLAETPSDSDVETAAERIEAARERDRSLDELRRRLAAAIGRQRASSESLRRATGELEAERARFADWKDEHGFDAPLSPDGVLECLAALQSARKDLAALERVDARIGQRRGEISEFEGRLATLAAGLSEVGGPAELLEVDPAGTLEDLCASLDRALELRSTRSSLRRAVEEADAEMERSLGRDREALELRVELEAGDVLAWNEEHAELTQARSQARHRLELVVRAHQDASNELRDLAGSARVAELEQQRLALEQELGECLKSWAVLGCAKLLLERTLRRHEQERQPAVLARAGERFAKVTEGRYTCLLPSVGDEAGGRDAIRVVSSSGAEMDASGLSRGSLEQLYLCLRLGLAETFAERAEALPLILDDVLVNFDPGRAASVAEALADTADRHQVLFFTCHPHLVKLVRQVAPDAQVVELERI
jgi:uncharacterized protein YhaN